MEGTRYECGVLSVSKAAVPVQRSSRVPIFYLDFSEGRIAEASEGGVTFERFASVTKRDRCAGPDGGIAPECRAKDDSALSQRASFRILRLRCPSISSATPSIDDIFPQRIRPAGPVGVSWRSAARWWFSMPLIFSAIR